MHEALRRKKIGFMPPGRQLGTVVRCIQLTELHPNSLHTSHISFHHNMKHIFNAEIGNVRKTLYTGPKSATQFFGLKMAPPPFGSIRFFCSLTRP